jgi:hypothetical protein
MIKTMDADGTGAVPMDPRLGYKTWYGEVDTFHGLICQVSFMAGALSLTLRKLQ